jgi:hypothetical protein
MAVDIRDCDSATSRRSFPEASPEIALPRGRTPGIRNSLRAVYFLAPIQISARPPEFASTSGTDSTGTNRGWCARDDVAKIRGIIDESKFREGRFEMNGIEHQVLRLRPTRGRRGAK